MGAPLHNFEGREVIGVTAKITNTGDGLSKSVALEPIEHELGDEVYLLVKTTVTGVAYKPVKDTSATVRQHTYSATLVTLVDKEFAAEKLEAQRIKIEQAKGVDRLDFAGGGDGEGGEGGGDGGE